jgi:hypothetical protein
VTDVVGDDSHKSVSEWNKLEANWTRPLLQLKTIEETNDEDCKVNPVRGLVISRLACSARD